MTFQGKGPVVGMVPYLLVASASTEECVVPQHQNSPILYKS